MMKQLAESRELSNKIVFINLYADMDYFLKRFPNIPYSAVMVLYCAVWAFFCAGFAYFLILSQADFEATGTRTVFVFSFLFYLVVAELLILAEHGALGFKATERKFSVLNENIKGGHISPDISTKALKEIFYSLSRRPIDGAQIGFTHSSLVILFSIITECLVSHGMVVNVAIIFFSGAIVILMLTVFIFFFVQYFVSFSLKECRTLLRQRGEEVKEPQYRFNKLGTKLNLSLSIPIFTVLITSLTFRIDLNVLIFVLISLVMTVSISRMLSFSIYQVFSEVKNFAKELPKGKKISFSTGSMDPEIITLSTNLDKAALEVYTAKKKVEKSSRELGKRVDELEKWYQSTVDREMEMVKLKKEIVTLKAEIEK